MNEWIKSLCDYAGGSHESHGPKDFFSPGPNETSTPGMVHAIVLAYLGSPWADLPIGLCAVMKLYLISSQV